MATPTPRPQTKEQREADFRRNIAAFETMHPRLLAQYEGQYVALYDGQLVDHDSDENALLDRIFARYGDDAPWIVQPVLKELYPTYVVPGIDVD